MDSVRASILDRSYTVGPHGSTLRDEILTWLYGDLIEEAAEPVRMLADRGRFLKRGNNIVKATSYIGDLRHDFALDAVIDATRTWDGRVNRKTGKPMPWVEFALSCAKLRMKNAYRPNGQSVKADPFVYDEADYDPLVNEPAAVPEQLPTEDVDFINTNPELYALSVLRSHYKLTNKALAECFKLSVRTVENRFQEIRESFPV